jgi:hypothetical protein
MLMMCYHVDPLFDHQFCFSSNYFLQESTWEVYFYFNYLFILQSKKFIILMQIWIFLNHFKIGLKLNILRVKLISLKN